MKISITLPSIYELTLGRAIENIRATTRNEYEVVVVSPFPVRGHGVVWVEETERRGCAFAHNVAVCHATGDFITAFADDWLYLDGWDERILPEFLDRETRWGSNYLMGLRYDHPNLDRDRIGITDANFPFMRRENLDRYGWIGPDYKLGFGDIDLSMRVWSSGGRCEFSPGKTSSRRKMICARAADFVLRKISSSFIEVGNHLRTRLGNRANQ